MRVPCTSSEIALSAHKAVPYLALCPTGRTSIYAECTSCIKIDSKMSKKRKRKPSSIHFNASVISFLSVLVQSSAEILMTIIREIYYIHLQRLNPLKIQQISPNRLQRALILNLNLWGKKKGAILHWWPPGRASLSRRWSPWPRRRLKKP